MLLIITSTGDGIFRFINIDDDLETPREGFFSNNFLQFLTAAHISSTNCDEMTRDRLRQPAYEISSIKRKF